MIFNGEYLIKFDNKYTTENFNCDKPLYFFLGVPNKREIKLKNVCASSYLVKDEVGIFIKGFQINNNAKGKNLTKLLNKESKKISIYRNIIKKSDIYSLSSVFINIVVYNSEEMKIIDKKGKLDDIMIL